MKRNEMRERAWEFLTALALSGKSATDQEFCAATGYAPGSLSAIYGKHVEDFRVVGEDKSFTVSREFLRLTKSDYLKQTSQKKPYFATYKRMIHPAVVVFDFFLPVSKEGRLRQSLDQLFFRDTITRRLQEITVPRLRRILGSPTSRSDQEILSDACTFVSERFGGYSVSHVNGRFRAEALMDRTEAAKLFAEDKAYLIDETTAVVRFIIPCDVASSTFDGRDLEAIEAISKNKAEDALLEREVATIRSLFFLIFVEEVTRVVHGEEQIWLLESGVHDQLFVWLKSDPPSGNRRRMPLRSTSVAH